MRARIISQFASHHPVPLSSWICQNYAVLWESKDKVPPTASWMKLLHNHRLKIILFIYKLEGRLFLNKCYEISTKILILVKWQISPIWKHWDRSIWKSIYIAFHSWSHQAWSLKTMNCAQDGPPHCCYLCQHVTRCFHLNPQYRDLWNVQEQEAEQEQTWHKSERKNTRCYWQGLLTPIFSIFGGFTYRFFSLWCTFSSIFSMLISQGIS